MGAQIAQYMADGLAKRYLSGFVGGFRGCRHGSCGNAFRVFLPPYAGQCGLALVFGLFGRAGTQHLLLGEHHRAALGWGEFPDAGVAALHRGNHRLEFHLFLGECHRVHAASPFRFSYVRPLWSTPIFVDYSCESAERVLSFSRIHCTVSCRTASRSPFRRSS